MLIIGVKAKVNKYINKASFKTTSNSNKRLLSLNSHMVLAGLDWSKTLIAKNIAQER